MFIPADCCSAEALKVAVLGTDVLYFCGHHGHVNLDALVAAGWTVTALSAIELESAVGVRPNGS